MAVFLTHSTPQDLQIVLNLFSSSSPAFISQSKSRACSMWLTHKRARHEASSRSMPPCEVATHAAVFQWA